MGNVLMINGNLAEKVEEISVDDFINTYKQKDEILKTIIVDYGDLNNFDSNRWVFYHEYINGNLPIIFDVYDELIAQGYMTRTDLDIIKCYVIDCVENGFALITVAGKVRNLKYIIEATHNFNDDYLKSINEGELLQAIKGCTPDYVDLSSVLDYFEFLDSTDLITQSQLLVYKLLSESDLRRALDREARELPSNKDILTFSLCLKRFYDEETDEKLLGLYMPVLLWWKITNVIPMRPSEITHNLERDCNIEKDGKYYIKVNRVKVNNEKVEKMKIKPSIPILNKIGITKEIYDLIEEYKRITAFDDITETLFSYNAYRLFLDNRLYELYGNRRELVESIDDIEVVYDYKRFTRRYLASLIEQFYKDIVEGRYGITTIEKQLRVGDTRHLAFCSLMLQGVSPIEIAMLGGHTHLISQDHYVGHSTYYIESEVLNYISGSQFTGITNKELKEIVFGMDRRCPKPLNECYETEDKVGYCTADLFGGNDICETNRSCVFCSKWWCYPDNESYIKAKKYLEQNVLGPLQQRLNDEEEFLRKLLRKVNVVTIGDLVELEKSDQEEVSSQTLKIRSTAQEIILLKKTLLEIHDKRIKE